MAEDVICLSSSDDEENTSKNTNGKVTNIYAAVKNPSSILPKKRKYYGDSTSSDNLTKKTKTAFLDNSIVKNTSPILPRKSTLPISKSLLIPRNIFTTSTPKQSDTSVESNKNDSSVRLSSSGNKSQQNSSKSQQNFNFGHVESVRSIPLSLKNKTATPSFDPKIENVTSINKNFLLNRQNKSPLSSLSPTPSTSKNLTPRASTSQNSPQPVKRNEPIAGCSQNLDTTPKRIKPQLVVKSREVLHDEIQNPFSMFLSACIRVERGSEMDKIISKLKKRYETLNPQYANSEEFKSLINEKRNLILQSNKPYVHIADIMLEMKNNQKSKVPQPATATAEPKVLEKEEKIEDVDVDQSSEMSKEDKHLNRKLRKVQAAMDACQEKIRRLEEIEVNWDEEEDSAYIKLERYKSKMVQLYQLQCQLRGEIADAGRTYLRPKHVSLLTGITSVDNAIMSFINSNITKNRTNAKNPQSFVEALVFPDHLDILQCIEKCNETKKLGLDKKKQAALAKKAFTELGEFLQRIRHEDYWDTFSIYLENQIDPATVNKELADKLRKSYREGKKKEQEVIENFTKKQCGLLLDSETSNSSSNHEEDEDNKNIVDNEIDNILLSDNETSEISESHEPIQNDLRNTIATQDVDVENIDEESDTNSQKSDIEVEDVEIKDAEEQDAEEEDVEEEDVEEEDAEVEDAEEEDAEEEDAEEENVEEDVEKHDVVEEEEDEKMEIEELENNQEENETLRQKMKEKETQEVDIETLETQDMISIDNEHKSGSGRFLNQSERLKWKSKQSKKDKEKENTPQASNILTGEVNRKSLEVNDSSKFLESDEEVSMKSTSSIEELVKKTCPKLVTVPVLKEIAIEQASSKIMNKSEASVVVKEVIIVKNTINHNSNDKVNDKSPSSITKFVVLSPSKEKSGNERRQSNSVSPSAVKKFLVLEKSPTTSKSTKDKNSSIEEMETFLTAKEDIDPLSDVTEANNDIVTEVEVVERSVIKVNNELLPMIKLQNKNVSNVSKATEDGTDANETLNGETLNSEKEVIATIDTDVNRSLVKEVAPIKEDISITTEVSPVSPSKLSADKSISSMEEVKECSTETDVKSKDVTAIPVNASPKNVPISNPEETKTPDASTTCRKESSKSTEISDSLVETSSSKVSEETVRTPSSTVTKNTNDAEQDSGNPKTDCMDDIIILDVLEWFDDEFSDDAVEVLESKRDKTKPSAKETTKNTPSSSSKKDGQSSLREAEKKTTPKVVKEGKAAESTSSKSISPRKSDGPSTENRRFLKVRSFAKHPQSWKDGDSPKIQKTPTNSSAKRYSVVDLTSDSPQGSSTQSSTSVKVSNSERTGMIDKTSVVVRTQVGTRNITADRVVNNYNITVNPPATRTKSPSAQNAQTPKHNQGQKPNVQTFKINPMSFTPNYQTFRPNNAQNSYTPQRHNSQPYRQNHQSSRQNYQTSRQNSQPFRQNSQNPHSSKQSSHVFRSQPYRQNNQSHKISPPQHFRNLSPNKQTSHIFQQVKKGALTIRAVTDTAKAAPSGSTPFGSHTYNNHGSRQGWDNYSSQNTPKNYKNVWSTSRSPHFK